MDKNYSVNHILKSTLRLICFDPKLWVISVVGAVITAVTWYCVQLLNGILLRTAVAGATGAQMVWTTFLLIFIGFCLTRIPTVLGYQLNSWAAERLTGKIQLKMVDHWLRQKELDAKQHHSGNVMTRIITDCGEKIADFYFQGAGIIIIEPFVTGILAFITVWSISSLLAVTMLTIGILSAFCSAHFSKAIHLAVLKSRDSNENTVRTFSNLFAGTMEMRLLGVEDKLVKECTESSRYTAEQETKGGNIKKQADLVARIFELFSLWSCLFISAWLSSNHLLYLPDVMIVLPMQALISNMMGGIGKSWNYLTEIGVSADRVFEIIDLPVEDERSNLPDFKPLEGDKIIDCKDIFFTYDQKRFVLRGLSLSVRKRTRTAIIGESGAGKSTILGLILNYFNATCGTITLSGIYPNECNLKSWRKQIALVQQESPLLDISIADNIAIGALRYGAKPTFAEIVNAAKKAEAHDFIKKLPYGYDTLAGEAGAALSGGQRQRIAIARAFISKSPLVLFDEPSSALDSESEKVVMEAIERLSAEKTVIVISHRISTIKDFDNIIVLQDGKVVEEGTHAELLNRGGVYAMQ